MPSKAKLAKSAPNMQSLIDLTKSTQGLLAHFQNSLAPSSSSSSNAVANSSSSNDATNPLDVIKSTTTLLKSHTTTLSLLLLTPPLTPSAIISKMADVTSGVLSSMVAAAASTPQAGQKDTVGEMMRGEIRAQVRRLLGTWGDLLGHILQFSERRRDMGGKKDEGPTESEKQDVLATTGVVWEACDALLKACEDGVVGLVVKRVEEWRGTLLDAVEELKEWGEDVEDEEEENKVEDSDEEDRGFGDEDDIFGAANKLGKGDKELKELLDTSVKKLKMVCMLYQALIKRRLKTFPKTSTVAATTNGDASGSTSDSLSKLDELMGQLKGIPETVDDLASTFYDLDGDEAKQTLDKCCKEAKTAAQLVKQSWAGKDDEFTAWSDKWVGALEAS